jgi:hypothetical protein
MDIHELLELKREMRANYLWDISQRGVIMSGPQFHQTGYGTRFFDSQLPALVNHLKTIGLNLVELNKILKKGLSWDADIHTIAESLALLAESSAVLMEIDVSDDRIRHIKSQLDDLLKSIRDLDRPEEDEYEGSDQIKEDKDRP